MSCCSLGLEMCVCYACQLDLTGFLSLQNLAQTEEMEAHGMEDDSVSTWNAAIVTKTEGITCQMFLQLRMMLLSAP